MAGPAYAQAPGNHASVETKEIYTTREGEGTTGLLKLSVKIALAGDRWLTQPTSGQPANSRAG